MFLFSSNKLESNSILNYDEVVNSFDFKLIEKDCFNIDSFFYKRLNPLHLDYGKIEFDLIDDIYTVCYFIELKQNKIYILNKMDLSICFNELLLHILNKPLDLNLPIANYLDMYIDINPEICYLISNNLDVILKLLKRSLFDSIDSVSAIYNIINKINISDEVFLKDVGMNIHSILDFNHFYPISLLNDLILLGDNKEIYDTTLLKEKYRLMLEEQNSFLPF